MSLRLHSRTGDAANETPAARRSRVAEFALRRMLSFVERGQLAVQLPSGVLIEHIGRLPGPRADLHLVNWRGLRRLALQGDIGFAESYVDGDWSSADLTALIELGAANSQRFSNAISGSPPYRLFNGLVHRLRANTPAGARRNVYAHYDLGNEFYRLWLDARMVYSSAIFSEPHATLEEAQETKLARVVDRLGVETGARVLELGCGWGALAARIAKHGARVTGVTLSRSQLELARAVGREETIEDRLDLRLEDYRDVDGRYDRIVSIEMIEAVGREYLPKFFEQIRERLEPGGRCVLQAITIAEERFADYCRRPDFIQRYIFPGGFLPTKTLMRETLERAGLRLASAETFAGSYALTLREWRRRFLAAWPEIERLGFPQSFRRTWEYYLCYCEAGFRAGAIDVGLYCVTHAQTPSTG
jgi:cyclopropane-fatty-acyl-phospholipid synthase